MLVFRPVALPSFFIKSRLFFDMQPAVSVIIPAYNAEKTIRHTLQSAASQTFNQLEIIVVDDGSTDRTAEIVEAFATSDPRISLLRQQNQGVAVARNLAIHAAKGEFIAPLDADDVWHPTKLEKQHSLFQSRPSLGLVYAWYRVIDDDDWVIECSPPTLARGDVHNWLLVENFIGNASSPLIRRSVLTATGGYDPSLRAAGAQGAEDLQMQLNIAAICDYDVVPEYLIGYRRSLSSMSTRYVVMLTSHRIVLETVRTRHPKLASFLFRWSDGVASAYYGSEAARTSPGAAIAPLVHATRIDPAALFHVFAKPSAQDLWRRLCRFVPRMLAVKQRMVPTSPHSICTSERFFDADPTFICQPFPPEWLRRRVQMALKTPTPRQLRESGPRSIDPSALVEDGA